MSVDKDYSDWIQYMSNAVNALCLFSGFTFTSITILLTLLPNPSHLSSQITLFILSAMLDLFLFLMGWQSIFLIYHCRNIPPLTRGMVTSSRLWFSSFGILCSAVVAMYVLWDLMYLALASGLALAVALSLFYVFAWKPYIKFRKKK